jgi:hypothetical protein
MHKRFEISLPIFAALLILTFFGACNVNSRADGDYVAKCRNKEADNLRLEHAI